LYENYGLPSFQFTFTTNNEVANIIANQIQPVLRDSLMQQFYYAEFPRPTLLNQATTPAAPAVFWHQSTTIANSTSGYFMSSTGSPVAINSGSSNTKYITVSSLVKFEAPAGYYFDANNRLKAGQPTLADQKLVIWASPTSIYLNGTNNGLGNLPSGIGPVVLNNFIPTGAIATEVIPIFITDLPINFEQSMLDQVLLNRNFGIGYDSLGDITGTPGNWYLITSTNLAENATWSQTNAGSTAGTNNDASWLVEFVTDGSTYTVSSRALEYLFGSVLQTRFFFYSDQQVYDSRTGSIIKDFVNVLKTNSRPDSSLPLAEDIRLDIVAQPVLSDGFVDDFQVLVSFKDSDADGVPDNPDFFNDIVKPSDEPNTKLVYLEKTVDFDNLERYLLVESGRVNSEYATLDDIELIKEQYANGQVFYATTPELFYELAISPITGLRTLTDVSNSWIARIGRQNLYYQYRHNSPLTSRIDPGTTNIIDLYVVTAQYYTAYQNYVRDVTGTVTEPSPPTINELTTAYQGLQDFKMISDTVILNSVEFKPLFGTKADETLRATIKVIKAYNSNASTSEIKNLVVTYMNEYFSLDKWDFGDTFYFSELAAYLHDNMAGVVSSVVLVPLDPQKSFGDLYEIRSAPNQIFVNAATVNNIDVIEALTSTNLRTAPGSGVI
jgi:hypothetical protein